MLKLAVIGLSPGNGHPYSWSAIVNGDYDAKVMGDCGFSLIPRYLAANRDTLGIEGARVTHIWTQDREISEHCARASGIKHVVDNLEDVAGFVDAVLLARDDPENHVAMAKRFLEAGMPLFIDKPLAITRQDLEYFKGQHEQGKFIMSCSSMRYAAENGPVKTELESLGQLELAVAIGKKDWVKYGVHMLEGLFALLDDPKAVSAKHISRAGKDIVYIEFEAGSVATVHLFQEIASTFQISLFGQDGWRNIEYSNWYAMFRNNLIEFIRSVQDGRPRLDFAKTENVILTLIAGQESLERDGKTVPVG